MSWWDEQSEHRRTRLMALLHSVHGKQYAHYADDNLVFAAWLLVADATCIRHFGLSIFDLSDWDWRNAFDAGDTPGSAVREAVHDDDMFGMLSSD